MGMELGGEEDAAGFIDSFDAVDDCAVIQERSFLLSMRIDASLKRVTIMSRL
jgi:hypothetical protein